MLKKVKTTIATAAILASSAGPAFAQTTKKATSLNPTTWNNLCDVIRAVLPPIYGIAGGIALVLLVMGGIQYMTSGGDKVAVEAARGRITAAVVGLMIVFGAYLVINVIGTNVIGDTLNLCD